MTLVIKNGFLLDLANEKIGKYDIEIEKNIIKNIEKNIAINENMEVIDANGKFISSGFIDLQVNPGQGIKEICDILPFVGITTPLIMPCNIKGKTFLDYYNGLENALKESHGQKVNVANAISIEPPDTGAHETYIQLSVEMDKIKERVKELKDLNVTALGEVVLPLGGIAHITSNMSNEFLDKLLDVSEIEDIPVLLHTGLGLNGIKEAINISKGRNLHICHVGSTVSQDSIHEALSKITINKNITCDTHLSEVAGSNSKNSQLVQEYFKKGEVLSLDSKTLKARIIKDLENENPPFYYNKINLFENNVICTMSDEVDAIESDDLGDGVRAKIMLKNFFKIVKSVSIEHSRLKLMCKLIKKMTYNPAKILKLNKRGSIKTGNYADIVIFDLDKEKIETVFVNGEIVLKDGSLTENNPGIRILYKEN